MEFLELVEKLKELDTEKKIGAIHHVGCNCLACTWDYTDKSMIYEFVKMTRSCGDDPPTNEQIHSYWSELGLAAVDLASGVRKLQDARAKMARENKKR